MRVRLPWSKPAPGAPLPAWLVRAHFNALILVCAAEIVRERPELIPIMRADLLTWARQAVEALKPAAAVVHSGNVLKFGSRKQQ